MPRALPLTLNHMNPNSAPIPAHLTLNISPLSSSYVNSVLGGRASGLSFTSGTTSFHSCCSSVLNYVDVIVKSGYDFNVELILFEEGMSLHRHSLFETLTTCIKLKSSNFFHVLLSVFIVYRIYFGAVVRKQTCILYFSVGVFL